MAPVNSESTPLVSYGTTVPSTKSAATTTKQQKTRSLLLTLAGVALLCTFLFVTQEKNNNTSSSISEIVYEATVNENAAAKQHHGNKEEEFFCGIMGHETGYIKLPKKRDDHYFYWFVESLSEPSKDPLVLWLTGGPGCSSMMALLAENGPCHVQPDLSTKLNPYSWNREANVIWLDQPTGVGYSYGPESDYDSTEVNVGENIYWFLQEFLRKHPDLVDRPFFVTGESYGGHYVPAAAGYIIRQNALRNHHSKTLHINIAGLAIGNGLTNPAVQYQYSVDMAFNNYNVTLLNPDQIEDMREAQPICRQLILDCQYDSSTCVDAMEYCFENLESPYYAAKRNPYDIRQPCDEEDIMKCFHFEHIDEFLNSNKVLAELGVNTKKSKAWRECDGDVGAGFAFDEMLSFADDVKLALESGLRVLIYAGDADLMCNWVGNQAWVLDLEWSGQEQFNGAPNRPFMTAEIQDAGMVRSFENLAFIRVFNSGHMVPMDQPAVAFEMINKFFHEQEY